MPFPIDIHLGTITIASHAVFELLAFFVGYRYYKYLKGKRAVEVLAPHAQTKIIIGMTIGAFLGSRLLAALEHPMLFIHPPAWLYYIGGQTIAGGILGGIIGVEITKKLLGITRKTGDFFVFPLIVGIMIGRVGCFLTGVKDGTVGLACAYSWCFDQGDGIARHPTSLYEILFLICMLVTLRIVERYNVLKEGDLFSVFVAGYAVFRLCVEFIKPREVLALGFSSIQFAMFVLVIHYIIYFIRRYK